MIWDRPWRKRRKSYDFNNGQYQGQNYDYNWTTYSRPARGSRSGGWGEDPRRKGRGTFFKIGVALAILAVLVAARNINHPVGEELRVGLKYVLTTEWNFQPVMDTAVKLGLNLVGADNPADSGIPVAAPYGNKGFAQGLAVPVSGQVVRGYGLATDPLDNLERFHPGIDIKAAPGTAVKAVLGGKVAKVGENPAFGRYVQLDHGAGTYTLYAGLAAIRVSSEQSVAAGEIIGEVAKNSEVDGGGLHFEFREKGKLVDPLTKMEFPPVK